MSSIAIAGVLLSVSVIVILLALIAIIVSGIHTILREISIDQLEFLYKPSFRFHILPFRVGEAGES